MRLGDAMRLGIMIHPRQAFNASVRYSEVVASCALSAAGYGGYSYRGAIGDTLDRHMRCPVCNGPQTVRFIIMCLNDTHRWSREKIADWVDTIDETPKESVIEEGELVAV